MAENMDYLHGLRTARDVVRQIWHDSIEESKKFAPMVNDITKKMNEFDYMSANYNALNWERERVHDDWSRHLGMCDSCVRIYDAIDALISEAINPKEVSA